MGDGGQMEPHEAVERGIETAREEVESDGGVMMGRWDPRQEDRWER